MIHRLLTDRRWLVGSATCALLGLGGTAPAQSPTPEAALPQTVSAVPGVSEILLSPAAPMSAPCPACGAAACESDCDKLLKKVPPVSPAPRAGFFPIPPAGPGYYSLYDALTGTERKAPPKYPYPRFALMQPSFFDANFKYLDDPKNEEHDFFDPLKRVRLGDCWLFSTGGSYWTRYMNEDNSRLTATDNTYMLNRVRAYGDLWYKDVFRVYAEYIGAFSNYQDLPPLPIDVNRSDFLNLFIDLKLAEVGGSPVYGRLGRQELLFGSQRLVSTLEWGNTRRTFQGARLFRKSEKLDVDLFWVRPMITRPGQIDDWDDQQEFAGAWATYKPKAGQSIDAYYLFLSNNNRVTQQNVVRAPFDLHTFGSRYTGDKDGFLWDFEGAVQLGDLNGQNVVAGMAAAGVGKHFKCAPLTPTVWVYYDYGSGDDSPNAGTAHTFNQLFAFGHHYLGWADQVGWQNIHDFNAHLYLYPTKWVTLWFQYHRFFLDSPRDALYNAGGNAIRRDATGASGTDVGHEFDFVGNIHLTKHSDVLVGYSRLFGGEFLERTATQGANRAADNGLFYLQYNFRW